MEAKELRIGNLVRDSDGLVKVTRHILGIIELFNTPGHSSKIQPIPLTEEWLLKFGFELNDNGEPQIDISQNNALSISIQDTPYKYGAWLCVKENWQWWLMSECKYVHQLQNLCFALTGEELIIKE